MGNGTSAPNGQSKNGNPNGNPTEPAAQPSTSKARSTSEGRKAERSPSTRQRQRELGLLDSDDDEGEGRPANYSVTALARGPSAQGQTTASAPLPPSKTSRASPRGATSAPLFRGERVERWHKGALIGKGASGAVYEAIEETTGALFCVKEVEFTEDFADNPADRQRFEALRAEVALLQELKHENVVRFMGIDKVGFCMYIMMELVTGGNIQEIVKQFGALSDDIACKYTRQIVEGLTYMHEKNIIHRDIKGANILVSVDGVVKLADFGTAKRIMNPEQLFCTLAGTPYWMAPEVVRQEGHGKPADVWSLGATVLQMITGLAPYQWLPPVPALFKIGHSTELPIPPDIKASPLVVDFLRGCFCRDANARPTIQELRLHPWLTTVSGVHVPLGPSSKGDSSEPTARSTNEALARRQNLKGDTHPKEEEEEILEFILQLTTTKQSGESPAATTPEADAEFDDAGGNNPPLEVFNEERFSEFVRNLGPSDDKSPS